MTRRGERANREWQTPARDNFKWDHVKIEVLMDIRAELRTLNRLLNCANFIGIPATLRSIRRNTTKPRKRRIK